MSLFKEFRNQFYQRPVSGNEKMYLAGNLMTPPFCVQALIEGTGNITIASLSKAVEIAADVNPGCRVLLTEGRFKNTFRWTDSGQNPPVRALFADFNSDEPSLQIAVKKPVDPFSGPTCSVYLARGIGKQFGILFCASHAVMDAHGVLHWMQDVFRALRGESPIGAPGTETDIELVQSIGCTENRPNLGFDCPPVTGERLGHERGYVHRRFQIAGKYPGLIARLVVILAKISWHNNPDGLVRFMVPVDLRRHLTSAMTTGNMSNPLFVEPKPTDNWATVHENIITSLLSKKEGAIGKYDHLLKHVPVTVFRWMFTAAKYVQYLSNRFPVSGILSNIGTVDMKDFSTPNFTASSLCFLPLDIPIAPVSIVTTENKDHVEILLSTPKNLGNNGRLDCLVECIKVGLDQPDLLSMDAVLSSYRGQRISVKHPVNDTDAELPLVSCVLSLIEEQALRTPSALALVDGAEQYDYRTLVESVNYRAQKLALKGVCSGDLVGIMMVRSAEMVLHLLAILKLGAAYIPIDPSYPDRRKAFIIKDSQMSLLVTEDKTQIPTECNVACYSVDANVCADTFCKHLQNEPLIARTDRVYVIYTSGSTGTPKGVEVEHGQLLNYINWASKVYTDNEACSMPLFTSLAFDLTVTSLYLPLITGGFIIVYREKEAFQSLLEIMKDDQVDIIKMTPSHLKMMLALGTSIEKIKKLIVGGEALSTNMCVRIQKHFGNLAIFNEYGPTEATVGCMLHQYSQSDDQRKAVPIGTPADNTRIYLLNEQLEPVGQGEIGEIFISGLSVARGYINNPDLTKEKFINNPFESNRRMYRSGDLGRWIDMSILEYCGRVDEQVKINGFRVEPGEIAAQILTHNDVQDAVVIPREEGNGSKSLCAFYILNEEKLSAEDATRIQGDIRSLLETRLPAYMIPKNFIAIKDIPVTVNGKLDHRQLLDHIEQSTEYKKSNEVRGTLDLEVQRIWADVLGESALSAEKNLSFYELGGDSMAMANMLWRVRSELLTEEQESAFSARMNNIIAKPTIENIVETIVDVVVS